MDYFVTGATGLVGSHVMFELLKKIDKEETDSKIFLLVRKGDFDTPLNRIRAILYDENTPAYLRRLPLERLIKRIVCVESDLNNPKLPQILGRLNSKKLIVVHSAASTNLMQGKGAEEDVFVNNYQGTLNLMKSLKSLSVIRFSFISTAFSCGIPEGVDVVENNFAEYSNITFRNPYEEHKNKIERILSNICSDQGIDLQVLRPAVVCGRLMDVPRYITTKFDVFYGWAKYFYKIKDKLGCSKIRIAINPEGSLSIVPVDYVAKVITKAIHMKKIKQLNIISKDPVMHKNYFGAILDKIGVRNYEFVDAMPEDLTTFEKLYYRSVGKVFEPYMCTKNLVYDAQLLSEAFGEFQFNNVKQQFGGLIQFAISKKFEESELKVQESDNCKVIQFTPPIVRMLRQKSTIRSRVAL